MKMELVLIFKTWIYNCDKRELNKMEDSERIEEALKKMRRNDKLSVVYDKQDLHSFMNQSRPEGLSDQQSAGPKLTFVSISEIVQEESKNPELEENKDIF